MKKKIPKLLWITLSVIVAITTPFSIIQLKKSHSYEAASTKTLVYREHFDRREYFMVNPYLTSTTTSNGPLYFPRDGAKVLSTTIPTDRYEQYGIHMTDWNQNFCYYYPIALTSQVYIKTCTEKIDDLSPYPYIYRVTGRSPECVATLEIFMDPNLAVKDHPLADMFIYKITYMDGNSVELIRNKDVAECMGLLQTCIAGSDSNETLTSPGYFLATQRYTDQTPLGTFSYRGCGSSVDTACGYTSLTPLEDVDKRYPPKYNAFFPEVYAGINVVPPLPCELSSGYFGFTQNGYKSMSYQYEGPSYRYNNQNIVENIPSQKIFYEPKTASEAELMQTVQRLTAKVAELTEKIANIQQTNSNLNNQLNQVTTELTNIKNSLQSSGLDMTSSLSVIEQSIRELRSQIESLRSERTALEEERASLLSQLTTIQTNNIELQNTINDLTNQLNNANNTINNLNDALTETSSKITDLSSNLLEIKAVLGLDPDATQSQIITKINLLKELINNYSNTISEIGTAVGSNNPSDAVAVKEQVIKTKQELDDLKAQIQTLKDMIERLGFSPTEDIQSQLQDLINSYNNNVSLLHTYENFIDTLIGQLGIDSNSSLDEILAGIKDLQDTLSQYQNSITNINNALHIDSSSSLMDTENALNNKLAELADLYKNFEILKTKLSAVVVLNGSLPTDKEKVQQAVDDFLALYDSTKAEADRLSEFVRDCKAALNLNDDATTRDILNKIRELQDKLLAANQKISNYNVNVNQMVDTLSMDGSVLTEDKISAVNYKTAEMVKELNITKAELEKLKAELASIGGGSGTPDDIRKLIDSLNKTIAESLAKVESLTNINSTIIKALGLSKGSNLDEVLKRISEMKSDISNLSSRNSELNNDNSRLTGENKSMSETNSYLKTLNENQLKELYDILKKVDKNTTDTVSYNNISTRIEEIEKSLSDELKDVEQSVINEVTNSTLQINNNIDELKSQISNLSTEQQDITGRLDGIDSKLDYITSLLARLDKPEDKETESQVIETGKYGQGDSSQTSSIIITTDDKPKQQKAITKSSAKKTTTTTKKVTSTPSVSSNESAKEVVVTSEESKSNKEKSTNVTSANSNIKAQVSKVKPAPKPSPVTSTQISESKSKVKQEPIKTPTVGEVSSGATTQKDYSIWILLLLLAVFIGCLAFVFYFTKPKKPTEQNDTNQPKTL